MQALMPLLPVVLAFALFPLASLMVLRGFPRQYSLKLFAVTNVVGSYCLCILAVAPSIHLRQAKLLFQVGSLAFLFYLCIVVIQFLNVRYVARSAGHYLSYVPLLFPILVLIVVKYIPELSEHAIRHLSVLSHVSPTIFFVGISYMAFRLSHLAVEVRNGVVERPDIWEFLSFAFFVPTLSVGPINPFSTFQRSLRSPDYTALPVRRSLMRLLVGATKYAFLATLLNQLSYSGLLLDGHPHFKIDLVVAVVAYYLYLYCNFSGYCDMAIGTAGLLGIEVNENFKDPLLARNIQEFWNRWHITLSTFMRDLVFSPVSKYLVVRFGPRGTNHAIAVSILLVFVLIGAWHGVGLNFVLFGAFHGVGVVTCHYYTIFLKRKLGRAGYAAYNRNPFIHGAAVIVTFCFAAVSLFLFACTPAMARAIWTSLR